VSGAPPQDRAAEEAVLGALLVTGGAWPAVEATGLDAGDFYLDRYAAVFATVADLAGRSEPHDEVAVATALENVGRLAQAGGRERLSALAASVPAAGNAGHYAAIVRERAVERAERSERQQIAQQVRDGLPVTEAMIDRLRALEAEAAEFAAAPLPWRWADDLAAETPVEPGWVFEGYLAAGTKAVLAGLPKAGKTTVEVALIEAIASDAPTFLGRRVGGGLVVLLSEEGDATLGPKMSGLPAGRVRVLNRDAGWPKPSWSELIADATREAIAIGAVLLVIDSLAFWAAFEPEREKDAGAAQAAIDALDQATRAGLAVLLIHHQRKAPGEYGTALRGSGALAGAVDIVIEYERLGEDAPRSQRRFVTFSRWPQTPDVLVIDYRRSDGTWRVVGEAEGRAESEGLGLRERLLSAVPIEPPGATETELAELVGLDGRKVGGPLRALVDGEEIERRGKGVKGSPYTYARKAPPDSPPPQGSIADEDSPHPARGGESNASLSVEGTERIGGSGCTSHPGSPVTGCRYCLAVEEATG
jgi:hypothetical protein